MEFEQLRANALKKVRQDVRVEKQKEDKLVVEAMQAIDELDDVFNLIVERVKTWYAYHYPELEKLVRDQSAYLEIIKEFKTKEQMMEESLKHFVGDEQAKRIAVQALDSMGADVQGKDLERIALMAELALHVKKERDELAKYVEERVQELAPNMHALVGGMLAARLIARAGSMQRLAEMPASTIQVLGAEKALFAHLRKGTPSPKHGLIFHSSYIIQAPRKMRGKIARALSSKLAIAAREDYFEGKDISKELVAGLEKRVAAIRGAKQ